MAHQVKDVSGSSALGASPVSVNGAPIDYDRAPENCRGTLMRYIEHGIPMGSFMTAFLSNDLMEAIGRADETNLRQFMEIAQFLYSYAPSQCFGSRAKVAAYAESRRELQVAE